MSGSVLQKDSIRDNELTEVREIVKVASRADPTVFGEVPVTINIIQSICTPNPCQNGGVCIGSVDSFTCQCSTGTAGETCECANEDCSNGGFCHYNSSMTVPMCLCEDGVYKDKCKTDPIIMIAIIAGAAFVLLVIIICVCAYCIVRSKRKKGKKAASTEFDHAVNGTKLGSHKRPKGKLQLQDNICMGVAVQLVGCGRQDLVQLISLLHK